MNFKLALLLLFGFVALAVAAPLESTEENAEPAEPVAADAEKPETPLEEDEPEEENDDENEEDEVENIADDLDDDEEDEENELTESEDPRRKKPAYKKGYWRPSRVFKTVYVKSCQKVRSSCRVRRGKKFHKRPCLKLRCCARACGVRRFIYFNRRRCSSRRSRWVAHKCSRKRCRSKFLKYLPLKG